MHLCLRLNGNWSNHLLILLFTGLRVTIDCKQENGNGGFKTRGTGELDVEGEFKVSLPEEIVEDGELKEDCYAQLHSASGTPCPAYGGLESSKLVLKVKTDEKHTFGLAKNKKLKFSPPICASSTAAYTRPSPVRPPVPTPPFWHRCRRCGRLICCGKVWRQETAAKEKPKMINVYWKLYRKQL